MRNLSMCTAPRRDSLHWSSTETSWDSLKSMVAGTPAEKKDCGSYLMGRLRGAVRRNTTLISRSVLTLDVDKPAPGFIDRFVASTHVAYLVHTTWSSAPDAPRYRILVPLSRDVDPDEYLAVAQQFSSRYDAGEGFDAACFRPAQYMFRPSAQHPEWYSYWVGEGEWLNPDDVLSEDRAAQATPARSRFKRDPYEIGGVVGAFNRAYRDWNLLIEEYQLPYRPDGDRWRLVGAHSAAGVSEIAPGLVYSNHANDPAFGQACSAFDLVRLHLYGELDDGRESTPINRRPSYLEMERRAADDPRVREEQAAAMKAELQELSDLIGDDGDDDTAPPGDDDTWIGKLARNRTGIPTNSIHNWDIIRRYDPVFRCLYYNGLTDTTETREDLPWRPLENGGPAITRVDLAALGQYLEREYGFQALPTQRIEDLVLTHAQKHWVNPVSEYLLGLRWDGTPRVEECLPGVRPTPFTRLVARKSMVSAVARMLDPGCKWDHILVLYGDEGLGKSHWVEKMSRRYVATLGRIQDKDTFLAMRRSWIMLADEGYSLRKADADALKEFLTRSEDVYRAPYDRETRAYPRHCVFWSTTNDETFLRAQSGNRRYLIVHCQDPVDFSLLTDEYIDQVWAEAVHMYRAGERLWLTPEESEMAAAHRIRFTEDEVSYGVVMEYVDGLYPPDWDHMSIYARQNWRRERADGVVRGDTRLETVCPLQIAVEAFDMRLDRIDRALLLTIGGVLKQSPEWTLVPGEKVEVPNYGPQQVFVRTDSLQDLI